MEINGKKISRKKTIKTLNKIDKVLSGATINTSLFPIEQCVYGETLENILTEQGFYGGGVERILSFEGFRDLM